MIRDSYVQFQRKKTIIFLHFSQTRLCCINLTYYKPQALHNGAPSPSLRQRGVVVVLQLEHTNRTADSSRISFLALLGRSDFGLGALCNF